jgi:tetratricopeptide (TPR) repeat protein
VLLDRCRQACFEDRDEDALEAINQAREISPDGPVVAQWYAKVLDKLSETALTHAIEFHAQDNLEAAREQYELALKYNPDNVRAREGLARDLLQLNYRAGMGEAYYRDGAQALSEWFLKQARSYFKYTIKYQPSNDRADNRKNEVESMLAEDRCTIAKELELRGQFAAAKNEYRIAMLLAPQLQLARDGFERTARESTAAAALREAERLTLKKDFDKALAVLAKGRTQTLVQGEAFDAAVLTVDEARLAASYDLARALEADYRYTEAVSTYDALLKQIDFYKDAIARRDTLQSYIEQAANLYKQALEAKDPEEQIQLLRRIQVFWPEYRDTHDRLKALGALQREP